ncbi:MAG: SPW repeat domain-containing protein [Myxococcota bacterium]
MWAQLLSAVIGIWVMASPSVLGYGRPLATSDWIVGPLIASFGLIAAWEITRALRWPNVVLAAWLALSAFVVGGVASGDVLVNHIVSAILVAGFSLVRGRQRHPFAGGWRSLGKARTLHG